MSDKMECDKVKTKSFTLHDLPIEERPRERLKSVGADKLTSQELLALILGRGVKGESVMNTARNLLKEFGSLKKILEASLQDIIKSTKGIGTAKASQLIACLEISRRVKKEEFDENIYQASREAIIKPEVAAELIKNEITNFDKEHFFVLSFDVRNKLISIKAISEGTLTASLVHPRETFESAIKNHAAQIIVGHNHPSGDPDPSEDDIKITKRLYDAGRIMGIELIDHIIVTKAGFKSLKNLGVI
jgi:DNA repair protein RadC